MSALRDRAKRLRANAFPGIWVDVFPCDAQVYSEVFPEAPNLLPRKAVFQLDFRDSSNWPVSITWEIAEVLNEAGGARVSLLAAALAPSSEQQ